MEKYQRGRKLGEGVYGQVYLAKRITDSAVVAIKRVKSQDPNGGIDRSILREIKYLTELSEANIINLYDVYVMDGNVHLVLEYCPYNLEDIIRDKSIYLESKHSKCLIYMLIQSVVQCHSNFILHRDLKPQNILFSDKTNVLKLTDFGLARAYGSPIQMTSTIVSLWYRAPELLMGAKYYSGAIDMWAVGCIVAEIILRVPLFQSESELDLLGKIFNVLGTPTTETWPGVENLPQYYSFEPRDPLDLRSLFPVTASSPAMTYNWLTEGAATTATTATTTVSTSWAPLSYNRYYSTGISVALDLLLRMLTLDPMKRISASDALKHPYFTTFPLPCQSHELPKPEISTEKF